MTLDEYQEAAKRTMDATQTPQELGDMTLLGLIGETGEIAEIVKKARFHGKPFAIDRLVEECGDLLWYTAAEFTGSDVPMSAVGKDTFTVIDELTRKSGLDDTSCVIGLCLATVDGSVEASKNRLRLMSRLLQNNGATLDQAAVVNVAKLQARYPDGFKKQGA